MKRVSNCREAKTINKTSIQYILSPNPQEDTMTKANDTQNDETQPSQSSSDPAKKDGVPLRRGKWTIQEEEYSDVMIKHFLDGTLPRNIGNITLRDFLACQLHCGHMRVTKKLYAAKHMRTGSRLGRVIYSHVSSMDSVRGLEALRELLYHRERFLATLGPGAYAKHQIQQYF